MSNNRVFVFDINLNGEYKGQLGFEYCPLFPIKEKDIRRFVGESIPSLKGTDFKVEPITSMEVGKYKKGKIYKKENG